MKAIVKITLVLLSSLTISCQGWLDVEPKTEVKSDIMFESESGFKDAIIGCYILMSKSSMYGRELTTGFLDVIAQQYSIDQNGGDYYRIKNFEYDRAESIISNIWGQAYTTIANVNNILENIENKENILHPTHYSIIKGEALGLRAFLHFELLRMFGWGDLENHPENLKRACIPYVTSYNKEITKQNTGEEVLPAIHKDLEEASVLLEKYDPWSTAKKNEAYVLPNDDKFYTNRMTRFNYWAVQATMARVYMWEGKRDKALSIVENFINNRSQIENLDWIKDQTINNEAEIERDLTFSTEHLFRLDVHKLYEGLRDLIDPDYNSPNPNNRLLFHTSEYAQKLFEIDDHVGNSDYRYTRLYTRATSKYSIRKFYDMENYKYSDRMPLIRMSEMYYMGAECLNRQGKTKDAVALLNVVRRNRGIAEDKMLPSGITSQKLTEEIEKEWKKEFLGEGQMFYFYKRLGYTKFPNSSLPITEKVYVLPIPEDEINVGGREPNSTTDENK